MKAIKILMLSVAALLLAAIAAVFSGLRYNITESVPIGFYWLQTAVPGRGDIVAVCPHKSDAIDLALSRGYIAPGSCPAGYGQLMKSVTAIGGDIVTITAEGITVNDQFIVNSQPKLVDPANRHLPVFRVHHHKLPAGEFLLLNTHHPYSYDGRYFGFVELSEIEGVAHPIFNNPRSTQND
jgi:conjugative transfer signal peptidase TraF